MQAWIAGVTAATFVLLSSAAFAVTKLTPKEIQDGFFNGEPFTS